jgi:MFS family permease
LTRSSAFRLSTVGLVLATAGLLGVSQWQAEVSLGWMVGTLFVQGVGLGLFQVANMDFVMGTIPRHQQGVAGSLTMVTRTVGVVGGATGGALLFGLLQAQYTAQLHTAGLAAAEVETQTFLLAFQETFWMATVVAAVACMLMGSNHFTARSS